MLRRAGLLAAATALLVPAAAGTATAEAAKSPVIKRVTPKRVFVGETMTIRGRNFRTGIGKNTVAFRRKGAKVVLVKAGKSTRKLLRVELPKRLEGILPVVNGTPVPTRLQVRVMSTRFGRRYTSRANSPIVGPEKPPAPPKPPTADPNGDCDGDGAVNRTDADDDNDLLADTLEETLKLDGCKPDSDRDGVEDGYEYQSARDLNDDEHQEPNQYLPYPEKRPYPNGLDRTDAGTDHDGDALTLKEEYDLWKYTIAQGSARTLTPLTYSAGEKYTLSARAGGTGRRSPTQPANGYDKHADFLAWAAGAGYATVHLADIGVDFADPQGNWFDARQPFDIRNMDRKNGVSADEQFYFDFGSGIRDGWLDDSERDEDADGLSNYHETLGCMSRGLWDKLFSKESPYPLTYAATRLDDADSDGDGIRDGADDQDHDDIPNIMECNRVLAAGIDDNADGRLDEDPRNAQSPRATINASGFVNPFNPCLPHYRSRACRDIVTGTPWAPFNADDKYYFIWD
jgi:IPT/TIG domain